MGCWRECVRVVMAGSTGAPPRRCVGRERGPGPDEPFETGELGRPGRLPHFGKLTHPEPVEAFLECLPAEQGSSSWPGPLQPQLRVSGHGPGPGQESLRGSHCSRRPAASLWASSMRDTRFPWKPLWVPALTSWNASPAALPQPLVDLAEDLPSQRTVVEKRQSGQRGGALCPSEFPLDSLMSVTPADATSSDRFHTGSLDPESAQPGHHPRRDAVG